MAHKDATACEALGPIYRRFRIGRDGHLDQSETYDISQLVRENGPREIVRIIIVT